MHYINVLHTLPAIAYSLLPAIKVNYPVTDPKAQTGVEV
jgi:hypothetical protein